MVTYYNKSDLVSFAIYLLSDKRKQMFIDAFNDDINSGVSNPEPVEDRLKKVHHSDFENWMSENVN